MPRSFSVLIARLASASPAMPVNFCFAMIHLLLCSCRLPHPNRPPNCRPDHFFRAARPAQVKPRVGHPDCEVVAAAVSPCLRARWTSRDMVLAYDPGLAHVVQDAEPSQISPISLSFH